MSLSRSTHFCSAVNTGCGELEELELTGRAMNGFPAIKMNRNYDVSSVHTIVCHVHPVSICFSLVYLVYELRDSGLGSSFDDRDQS